MKSSVIRPGELWLDDRGAHIQAHGGGIIKLDETWYWFGEDRAKDNDPNKRYVSCYSSSDLVNWKFRNQVLALEDPEGFGDDWVLERPKVFWNRRTKQFVIYVHVDGTSQSDLKPYGIASIGIATCDTVDGDYTYLRHFRPFGLESRDIGQYIDDDGTPYLIFECRPDHGFYIASLTADYLDVDQKICFIASPLEGGAIVHHDGLYYVIGSALTGWRPNPNRYATARRLEGPWSEFRDFAPPHTNTYASQSSNLVKVVGSEATTVIYVGDRWRPEEQWDSRYIWMPMEIGDGNLWLPEPSPWTIDVATGVSKQLGVTGDI